MSAVHSKSGFLWAELSRVVNTEFALNDDIIISLRFWLTWLTVSGLMVNVVCGQLRDISYECEPSQLSGHILIRHRHSEQLEYLNFTLDQIT